MRLPRTFTGDATARACRTIAFGEALVVGLALALGEAIVVVAWIAWALFTQSSLPL